jgi:hypothetical protein
MGEEVPDEQTRAEAGVSAHDVGDETPPLDRRARPIRRLTAEDRRLRRLQVRVGVGPW